jgi:DNA (cytosine-5)-methyltransferase 1
MIHVSLFSGIGGFSLACDWLGIETILHCEIDPFCQKVLKKHWLDTPIVKDVNDVEEIKRIVTDASGRHGDGWAESRDRGARGAWIPDSLILTAGFPCQPFSAAGRRRGKADDRYLWPQTLAVIAAIRPDWVLLENVAGLLSMVFPDSQVDVASQGSFLSVPNDEIADYDTISGGIDRDLRQAGYETLWLLIPACGVGAPHRRDRVWIVANSSSNGYEGWNTSQEGQQSGRGGKAWSQSTSPNGALRNAADPHRWKENWYEVATRLCRVDDGVSRVVDRVARLKALGNAIVPQVAYEVLKTIVKEGNELSRTL